VLGVLLLIRHLIPTYYDDWVISKCGSVFAYSAFTTGNIMDGKPDVGGTGDFDTYM
jgi:hypothetical protein